MAASDVQYDALAQQYERAKHIPTGLAERATLLAALPDLTDRSVLDVACGTGFYARLYRDRGATRVVGVDSSAEMVAHARDVEEREPLGIEYHHLDATSLPVLGSFDVVTAVWLLGYAADPTAMATMVANLRANVVPGGRVVVLVPNPDVDWDVMDGYFRYGYVVHRSGADRVPQPVTVHVLGDPPFDFDSFFWPPGTYETALAEGGLTGISRHPTVIPADDQSEAFWEPLRRSPSFAVYSGTT
ncbi:class I SAM-dependent methyltransferase [Actinokineospora auranticolor]|uniref:Methyltransferase family protein n=1 Tax=Actinokineospora auranticolor TaxID=155976 RepID=A0A2S6H0D1_9PSEU|nr:class I SAM-dependent methyltransferase [Actinokineospora auranticolor]PPK70933.1 methyltransferase family protein [Actinokineospora auranticolor]